MKYLLLFSFYFRIEWWRHTKFRKRREELQKNKKQKDLLKTNKESRFTNNKIERNVVILLYFFKKIKAEEQETINKTDSYKKIIFK